MVGGGGGCERSPGTRVLLRDRWRASDVSDGLMLFRPLEEERGRRREGGGADKKEGREREREKTEEGQSRRCFTLGP